MNEQEKALVLVYKAMFSHKKHLCVFCKGLAVSALNACEDTYPAFGKEILR